MSCYLRFHRRSGSNPASLTLTTRNTLRHERATVVFADTVAVLGEVKTADLCGRLTMPMPGSVEFSLKEPLGCHEVLDALTGILPQLERLDEEIQHALSTPIAEVH